MKTLEQFAQSIVEQTSAVLNVSMSITDEQGLIIGSNQKERIGTIHKVSTQVIQQGREVIFTKEQAAPLENVLPGVAAPIRFHQQIIGVLGIIGDPIKVRKYVRFVLNHIEMILQENFRTESFFVQMKMIEVFVQHLIHLDEWKDYKKLEGYCEMLGFHFDKPRVCIMIHLPSLAKTNIEVDQFVKPSQIELNELINHLLQGSAEDIICPISQDKWIVIKQVNSKQFHSLKVQCEKAAKQLAIFMRRKQSPCKVTISFGNRYSGFDGACRSYHQAFKTLKIGLNKRKEENVYQFDSWAILPDVLFEEVDLSFLELYADDIGKIWESPESEMLIQTFIIYCENNLNVSQAARSLYIHRNTLIYRLNKIKELLNIDIQSFKQCAVLYITLKKVIEGTLIKDGSRGLRN